MHRIFIALLLCLGFAASAHAEGGRAFPPDNCSGANPFMAFNGVETGGNTYCINGQSVLSNALPGCGDGQQVVFEGGQFVCKTASGTPPNCAAGQFLTFTNGNYGCASTTVPTCQANYVLTYNGSAFVCVPKSASIPTCDANQFLTYNGTSFQCAATQNLTVPTCAAGEILTGSGGQLVCEAPGPSSFAVEEIGRGGFGYSSLGSNTSLYSGKKFSDYSAIVATYDNFGSGYTGTAFIPTSAFTGAFPLGQQYGFFGLYAGLEGDGYGYVILRRVNDTTFVVTGSSGARAILWGIR
jgi:hypothetical protein